MQKNVARDHNSTCTNQRRSDNSAPELSEATLFSKKRIIMPIQQKAKEDKCHTKLILAGC